ncbi:MAG: hypothetical protein RIQ89_2413 [Bacteroidota bacterium]
MVLFLHRKVYWILLAFFSLPIFLIGANGSHDWGDDFAQYIIQARNLVLGQPMTSNGYQHDTVFPHIAVKAYPIGFPALIAPVFYFFQLQIHYYQLLMSLLLIMYGSVCFNFYKKHFSKFTALCLSLCLIYHPWMLQFKDEVLSDLPMSILFLIVITIWDKGIDEPRFFYKFSTALIALISFKVIGITLLLAYVLWGIIRYIKEPARLWKFSSHSIKLSVTVIGCYVLINQIFFNIQSQSFIEYYATAYEQYNLWESIHRNIYYYNLVVKDFFYFRDTGFNYVSALFSNSIWLWLCLGLLCLIWTRSWVMLSTLVVYVTVILCYPNSNGGFRFLLPILFIMLGALGLVLQVLLNKIRNYFHLNRLIVPLVALLFYLPAVTSKAEELQFIRDGADKPEVKADLQTIKKIVDGKVVCFAKPRLLYLYTALPAISLLNDFDSKVTDAYLKRNNCTMLLHHLNIPDPSLDRYLDHHPATIVWQQHSFTLYKIVI